MVHRAELEGELKRLLEPEAFKDYCPNGLQVQGRDEIERVVSGVTASQALVRAAIDKGADAILVHHGYFWRNDNPCITGLRYERIKLLLDAGISLFAYHLPLDAHPEFGNNAQLAKRLGIQVEGGLDPGNPRSVGNVGRLAAATTGADFARIIEQRLKRKPLHIAGGDRPVKRIAWCTGGAQGYIEQAIALGVDAYITGEASEQTVHLARETGIHFYAAGHHATERYGVQAVGHWLAEHFQIRHEFVDIDNPV
jgi:dinuclear metal center YbgI/SA1388 family protein